MRKLFVPLLILLIAAFLRFNQLATYPPGPHFDEAANVLITRSIALGGANLFPIANSYQGRESLYYYLNVPLFRWVDDSILVLRFASVFINLLTIATAITLGRAMFPGRRGEVIGVLAGAIMAISFHQIFMSRQAYRAVTLPLMQGLGLLFLWRGLSLWSRRKMQARGLLVLGGVFAAGALYTYMASRLFPMWLALAGLVLLWVDRKNWRVRVQQAAIFFGALLVAALPMLIYALNNPDIFFQRLDEVTTGEVTITLWESIRRHVEMFFIHGDFGNLRYNVPGRPYFTLPEGILLMVGLGVVLWRLLRQGKPETRTAYFLLLISPLMVIPSVISVSGFPPSHMRSLGMVPLIFLVVAVGLEAVLARIQRTNLTTLTTLVILLVGGVTVYNTYFNWAKRADLFYQADGDLAAAVQWLPEHVTAETSVYIASFHREHPTIISAWDHPVTWLGQDSFVLPQDEGVVIFAHGTPPQPDFLPLLPDTLAPDIPIGPDGSPAFTAYVLHTESDFTGYEAPQTPIRNPYMTLVGLRGTPTASGETATITMAWHIDQSPPYYRLRPVMDLQNGEGVVLANSDAFLLGTNNWKPGEVVFQQIKVAIPVGTPPGDYGLKMTWVDRDSETYVSYLDDEGAFGGISAIIGNVQVTRPQTFPDDVAMAIHQPQDITSGIRLLGWNPAAASARPGEVLTPELFWQAQSTQPESPEFHVLLGDRVIWQGELAYAPSEWQQGELIALPMQWPIPQDMPSGTYPLALEAADQRVNLGEVAIEGIARLYTPPEVETMINIQFNGVLLLYGYNLSVENGINIDLVWSSLQPIHENYTVFIHLLDADGNRIDQRDSMPLQNTYPTSLWMTDEYIVDPFKFENLPPGEYTLRIGWYLQSSGVRLFTSEGKDYYDVDGIILEP